MPSRRRWAGCLAGERAEDLVAPAERLRSAQGADGPFHLPDARHATDTRAFRFEQRGVGFLEWENRVVRAQDPVEQVRSGLQVGCQLADATLRHDRARDPCLPERLPDRPLTGSGCAFEVVEGAVGRELEHALGAGIPRPDILQRLLREDVRDRHGEVLEERARLAGLVRVGDHRCDRNPQVEARGNFYEHNCDLLCVRRQLGEVQGTPFGQNVKDFLLENTRSPGASRTPRFLCYLLNVALMIVASSPASATNPAADAVSSPSSYPTRAASSPAV